MFHTVWTASIHNWVRVTALAVGLLAGQSTGLPPGLSTAISDLMHRLGISLWKVGLSVGNLWSWVWVGCV